MEIDIRIENKYVVIVSPDEKRYIGFYTGRIETPYSIEQFDTLEAVKQKYPDLETE